MGWIQRHAVMLLLGVAMASISVIGIYLVGYERGKNSVVSKIQKETIQNVKEGQTIELKVMRKPDNEVQKELERRWCPSCLQS